MLTGISIKSMVVENVNCLFLASLVFSHSSCQHHPIVVRSLLLHSITALFLVHNEFKANEYWWKKKAKQEKMRNGNLDSRVPEKNIKNYFEQSAYAWKRKRERWRWVSSAFSFRMLATLAYKCEFTYFFHLPWLCSILWYVFQSSKKVAFIWAAFLLL